MSLALLNLMHLADSALPVGSAAHSFGLETLVEEQIVTPTNLRAFLSGWLEETGVLEAVFCRAAITSKNWVELNQRLGAMKPARESREASARLGRRFLTLATDLTQNPALQTALECETVYYATAFGRVGQTLELDSDLIAATYLHSAVGNLIWAGQRLMPIGQSLAGQLWWHLKPKILQTVEQSREFKPETVGSFMPVLDSASMRHPDLNTRLFIS